MLFLPPDLLAMSAAGLITGTLAFRLSRQPARAATLPLTLALAFATLWAFDVVVEFSLSNWGWKYVLAMAKPFAVMGLVSSLLILAVEHTGSFSQLRQRHFRILSLVPLGTLVLTFSPESLKLYRFAFRLRPHGSLQALTWTGGPWESLVHYYNYGLAAAAFFLFSRAALHAHRGYRRAMLVTSASWTVPFVSDLTSRLNLTSQEANLTGWGLLFGAVVTAWGIWAERLFSVGPIARHLVVEQMADLLFVLDVDGRLIDCNARAEATLRLPGKAWLNINPITLPPPWPEVLGNTDQIFVHLQLPAPLAAGPARTFERFETPIHDKRDTLVGRAVLLHDISHLETMRHQITLKNEALAAANLALTHEMVQRHAAEQRLIEAARMETVGRLAGGIAHDFNNLLTAINGYSALLLAHFDNAATTSGSDIDRLHVEQISRAGERAAELTSQLLAFSRRQTIQPRPLNLNTIVTEASVMLSRILPENIRMMTRLDPTLGHVLADSGQFHQVLMNLSANARDAMPDGGQLVVETANVDLHPPDAAIQPGLIPGPYIQLTITDTGSGMDETARTRAFEPFFTTKPVGQGTGLGLAMVYGIIRQSEGWVWLNSQPGVGTSFRICLPRVNADETKPAHPTPGTQSGHETILVVEDQADVRNLVSHVLRECGYRVLESADGASALELARQYEDPIHLLLTDIVMPGIPGTELAAHLQPLRPGLRVLFMSGYSENNLSTLSPFIQKPMTPAELSTRVREVLATVHQ